MGNAQSVMAIVNQYEAKKKEKELNRQVAVVYAKFCGAAFGVGIGVAVIGGVVGYVAETIFGE